MRPWKVLEEGFHLRIRRRLLNEYAVLNGLAVAIGVLAGLGALLFRYLLWAVQSAFHNGGVLYGQPWLAPSIFNLDPAFF